MAVVVPFTPASDASIDRLVELTNAEMARVNTEILSRTGSEVTMIPEVANHLISSGGKRLRPLLTLAMASLTGYTGDHHIKLAAAVEFMHTATLLHDDVVDESDLRRGRETAKAVFGNQASVLVGDFLFSRAFQLMVADGALPVLKLLADTAATLAEGEVPAEHGADAGRAQPGVAERAGEIDRRAPVLKVECRFEVRRESACHSLATDFVSEKVETEVRRRLRRLRISRPRRAVRQPDRQGPDALAADEHGDLRRAALRRQPVVARQELPPLLAVTLDDQAVVLVAELDADAGDAG